MRNPALDFLRFVAVGLVLFRHMPAPAGVGGYGVYDLLQRGGWIGVDLFFVLSGWLISGLLFEEHRLTGHIKVFRFWIRRGFKLYPGLWALTAFGMLLSLLQSGRLPPRGLYFHDLLFLQNYLPGLRGHEWSLAVEEHFYFLLPLFLLWLIRKGRLEAVPLAALSLAVYGTCARALTMRYCKGLSLDESFYVFLTPTHLRIDSLFWGVCLRYLSIYKPESLEGLARRRPGATLVAGCIMVAPAFVTPIATGFAVKATALYVGFGLILIVVARAKPPQSRLFRFACDAGRFSYSIYLWHLDVYRFVDWLHLPLLPGCIIKFTGALAAGVLLGKIIEIPALKLREKLFPSTVYAPGWDAQGSGATQLKIVAPHGDS